MSHAQGEFRFHHDVPVRFRDVDVGGHAHHSVALIFFEEARAAYWRDVVGRQGLGDIDYIMGEVTVRFHARVLWPGVVRVGARVSVLGRKHWVMEYEVVDGGSGERLASGNSVQVMYDYASSSTQRVPAEVRDAVVAHEGGLPSRRDK